MAVVIYFICCAINSVLMHHLGISINQLEWWASTTLILVSWICGNEYSKKYNK